MCPLCRVAHKADREYIWHFFDEGSDQGESIDAVRRAFGFCDQHIEMLRRIELDGMRSTLAISTMFADTFAGIVADLDSLAPNAPFHRASCPACANRDKLVEANGQYLLDELATSPGDREDYESSPGLCFAHFELVWRLAQTREERELLLTVQRNIGPLAAERAPRACAQARRQVPSRTQGRRARFLAAGDLFDRRLAAPGPVGGRAGAPPVRVKVRAVIMRDGKLAVSRERRRGREHVLLPGGTGPGR